MTREKIMEVIEIYRKQFKEIKGLDGNSLPKWRFPATEKTSGAATRHTFAHLHWMLDRIPEFMDEGRTEKAHRWLGFVQGALWAAGRFTIEELKNQNRSDKAWPETPSEF